MIPAQLLRACPAFHEFMKGIIHPPDSFVERAHDLQHTIVQNGELLWSC